MRASTVVATGFASLLVSACGDDGGSGNPRVLWLYLDGRETETKLVDDEPTPF
jgi:hypothetical protein